MSKDNTKDINIEWCNWSEIVNKAFIPLIENRDRYLILYGGRGSSKSNFAAKKLIYRCLTENYFKCILVRRIYDTIKESSYEEIKKAIYELGLEELFQFKISPLEIICINGNRFIARGMDKVQKLKSIKDPSCIWYEEDIPGEDDFVTITTGVRTAKADYLQEIFTINPECDGNYQDFWFYKYFFENHPTEKSFSDKTIVNIGNGKKSEVTYTVHHSTYADNRWINDDFIGKMMDLKRTNAYRYSVYCLGEWGNKEAGGLFYKLFSRATNTSKDIAYNPDLALHISFDFNVNPYMSATIWQVYGKEALCIDEIASPTPNNSSKGICKEILRRYQGHNTGVFIYGDCNGRNQDTRSEKGFNDFKIIESELQKFRPQLRVPSKNPPVVMRGQFINTVFDNGFNGIIIVISDKCTHLINDFLNLKEAQDGTKLKEKTSKDGVSYEKWGHFSDTFDYFICEAFKTDFYHYQNGNRPLHYTLGKQPFNTRFKY